MNEPRVGEREREHEQSTSEWAGAPREGQMPVRASGSAPAVADVAGAPPESSASRWTRRALRVLRDAVIGAVIVGMVPLGLATLAGSSRAPSFLWGPTGSTIAKFSEALQARALAVAKDRTISPDQAGVLMASLQPERPGVEKSFTLRSRNTLIPRPWAAQQVPKGLFADQNRSGWNGPNPSTILQLTAKGLTPQQFDYLRMIATAPVWPAYDLVARAPSVDLIGGRFLLPFKSEARAYDLPIWRFAATKELAYASVSRAAYYLAIGQKAEADAVLRRTIGFGFVFIDNATSTLDALIGRVIVGIGRNALQDLYTVTHDPRLPDVVAAGREIKIPGGDFSPWRLTVEELRSKSLSDATNPSLPRAVRLQSLNTLAQSVCTRPTEMILGPARDVRDAYARGQRDLARFPSERAMLDLMLQTPSLSIEPVIPTNPVVRVMVGTSTIASIIFQNPRMAYCARLIAGM